MIVAIASGKGGTGKTTVALSLALAADRPVRLLDCDVEEPNCHLFLAGEQTFREDVTLPTPAVDLDACTACGTCGETCQFGGIIVLPTGAHVFPGLCHACGACVRLCPAGALREEPRRIGELTEIQAGTITLITGRLDVGQTLAPPVVRAVRARGDGEELQIVDAPPGTSCPVVAAVRGADVVVLVTEPTPFGLNDLELAVETVRRLGLPFGVIVNRAGAGDARVHEYCAKEGIPILMEIPQDRRIAEAYARGLPVVSACPELRPAFLALLDRLAEMARHAVMVRTCGRRVFYAVDEGVNL
ncbi:MAG: ATP-binding protein [Thermoanaerobaculaceae bacterium]|nr:ATP-binding protein [Thermoanaerobaculaceae bacterium]